MTSPATMGEILCTTRRVQLEGEAVLHQHVACCSRGRHALEAPLDISPPPLGTHNATSALLLTRTTTPHTPHDRTHTRRAACSHPVAVVV